MSRRLRASENNRLNESKPVAEVYLEEGPTGSDVIRLVVRNDLTEQVIMHINGDGTYSRIQCNEKAAAKLGLELDDSQCVVDSSTLARSPDQKFGMGDLEELESIALSAVDHVAAANYCEREAEAKGWVAKAFESAFSKFHKESD